MPVALRYYAFGAVREVHGRTGEAWARGAVEGFLKELYLEREKWSEQV